MAPLFVFQHLVKLHPAIGLSTSADPKIEHRSDEDVLSNATPLCWAARQPCAMMRWAKTGQWDHLAPESSPKPPESMTSKTLLESLMIAALALSGCAVSAPEASVDRALYSDLRKIVETRQRTSWFLDSKELDDSLPLALRSLCVCDPVHHEAVSTWLRAEIEAMGGPAEAAFEARGRDLDEVEALLTLERTLMVLTHGLEHLDQCPFWVESDSDFTGIHSNADRFVLLVESNGGGSMIVSDSKVGFAGGGGGRVLGAYGLGEGMTLGLGGEMGGRGALGDAQDSNISANFVVGLPLLLRLHSLSRAYDLEAMLTGTSNPADFDFRPGLRLTLAFGLSTVRVGAFMPTILGMLNYEFQPSHEALPTTHIFRIGTRFSISLDP